MSDKRDLIVVDTETTGLIEGVHRPLEIAAINLTTGEELYFVPWLPNGTLDAADGKAMKINRYFERGVFADRLSKPDTQNKWYQLWDMLAGNTLAGSNPTFDAAMLNRDAKENGLEPSPWHHRLADLSAYAAGALGIYPNELPGLDVVARSLHIDIDGAHSALGDARATAACFRALIDSATSKDAA